jgi:signal transduction histidine kinase
MQLRVVEEGHGINNEKKRRIFEKYFRGAHRQTKGTGLGLYLTREIVKQHHGEIIVENNIPKGCVFEIQFKASRNS